MNIHEAFRQATPRPWSVDGAIMPGPEGSESICIWGPEGEGMGRAAMAFAECGGLHNDDELCANAALLAHCYNHFLPLLEKAKAILPLCARDDIADEWEEDFIALAKAIAAAEEVDGL